MTSSIIIGLLLSHARTRLVPAGPELSTHAEQTDQCPQTDRIPQGKSLEGRLLWRLLPPDWLSPSAGLKKICSVDGEQWRTITRILFNLNLRYYVAQMQFKCGHALFPTSQVLKWLLLHSYRWNLYPIYQSSVWWQNYKPGPDYTRNYIRCLNNNNIKKSTYLAWK